jgi:hypothetical protein
MNIENLSSAQLRKAATIKDQITSLQSQLGKILGGAGTVGEGATKPAKAASKRRTMSAATKAALSKKLKAAWARRKAAAAKK